MTGFLKETWRLGKKWRPFPSDKRLSTSLFAMRAERASEQVRCQTRTTCGRASEPKGLARPTEQQRGRAPLAAEVSAAGQVSMEYLGITAFFLISAGIFFTYALVNFGENKGLALGGDAVSRIASNANLVASMGDSSSLLFEVEFPENAELLSARDKVVELTYKGAGGNNKAYAYSKAWLSEFSAQVSSGRALMKVSFLDGNVSIQMGG